MARVSFAGNFFAAGGIETIAVELADAALTVRDAAVCLCSTDEIYAKEAATAVKALAAAGARHIYLAGRPRDAAPLSAAGIGTFIFAGCDALATLRAAHDILGIR